MDSATLSRFLDKASLTGACWEWQAYRNADGYGQFRVGTQTCRAHRVSYEHFVGPIPEGLQLDHLCRNRGCVRPSHLEPVTGQENVVRGDGPTLLQERNVATTHCPAGHEYTPENTHMWSGWRYCRQCRRDRDRERKRQGRAALRGSR